MKKLRISLLLFIFITYAVRATVTVPSVLVQTYSVNDYNASCQNWDIAVSNQGLLYIANDEGLLTFDGNSWNKYQLPDRSAITKVTFKKDTVYTQGESLQGFWLENNMGDMIYHSLDLIPPHINDDDKQLINHPLPSAIQEAIPTVQATAGNLNFIGTATNGLYITSMEGEILLHLSLQNLLPDNMIHAICVQDINLIWVALDNGICQIDINPPIIQLGKRGELGKLEKVFLEGEELYLQTNIGYFKRQLNSTDSFQTINEEIFSSIPSRSIPPSDLSPEKIFPNPEVLESFINADHVYPSVHNMYWLTKGNEAALFIQEKDNYTLKCRVMFNNYNLNLVTRGQQFFPLNDSLYVISAVQGTYLINTHRLIGESMGSFTPPRFSRLSYSDKEGKHELLPATEHMLLPYNFQELSVDVGTTIFTPIHQISYLIEGVSTDWSSWQKTGRISFLQLPEGVYTMRIRKYVVRGAFPEITLQIEVRPPWYNTIWAYVVYILLFWIIIHQVLRSHLRNLRKKEEEKQKVQLQQEEQKMQQLKNEMLEAELQNKNNELTLQTSALLKRNQAVRDLIEELDKQKDSLGDRYPNKMYKKLHTLMEEAISDQADWLLFESYFNSAHQNFTERLRLQYDDLTPGDLRVCCLLKMNLSSKEIASLLNISIRAVELRRYRLRKRLSLEGDTNLVNFLMSF